MNFTVGLIAAVGVLVAISLVFISMDSGYIVEPQVKPVACTTEYAPVCGADAVTYGNSCMLNAANVKLVHAGECIQKPLQDGWTRATSAQHPGIGHESHQSVSVIPLSEKVSSGTLHYDASEPIQLIALHGPLKDGETKGQPTWTVDGTTKYALTFVTPDSATGEWKFAGNALAVHTKNTIPFTIDYKVDFSSMSDDIIAGSMDSVQDPGMGHESHQIAVIIPPSSDVYSGILSYSASEPIQLITLRGPIGSDEHPEKIWTVDGTNIFEMTFVDPKNAMGSWEFAGNALAVHTKNTTQFTVSYSVVAAKIAVPPASGISLAPSTFNVSIPQGVSASGCETTHECYLPYSLKIQVGDTVLWGNDDTAAHTVTSGTSDGIDGIFDSGLFMSGNTFDYTFDKSGTYHYFCMVHPWMTGEVIVNETFDAEHGIAVGEPTPVEEPADEPTPVEEPAEKRAAPVEVTIAKGSSAPGCETTHECYLPYTVEIYSGESVVWINADSAAHTVTSGSPAIHDGLFDSGMLVPDQKWDHVFTDSGEYDYHCMLHPWMTGKVIVQ